MGPNRTHEDNTEQKNIRYINYAGTNIRENIKTRKINHLIYPWSQKKLVKNIKELYLTRTEEKNDDGVSMNKTAQQDTYAEW